MSLRNVELQTVALHVGSPNYALINHGTNIPLPKAGVLTCPGISIFGDANVGEKATVTIYPPHKDSKQSGIFSLYVKGDSAFIGDIAVNGSQTITKNLTIDGTMRAGFATWSSSIVATSKLFDIKHPSKGKGNRLAHGSLEGPELGVYYRGRLKDSNTIQLPSYWKDLVHEDSISVQLQPIGDRHFHLNVTQFDNEKIIIAEADDKPIDCFYHVYGERKDVDKLKVEYEGDTILEQGKPK